MLAQVQDRYGKTFRVYDKRYTRKIDFIHDLQEHGYIVLEIYE